MREPTYLHLRPLADGETVHRTHAVSDNLNVDTDVHGWILGIERLDGPVRRSDLITVLMAVRWPP